MAPQAPKQVHNYQMGDSENKKSAGNSFVTYYVPLSIYIYSVSVSAANQCFIYLYSYCAIQPAS